MTTTSSSEDKLEPFLLQPFFSERVWGRSSLEPWFTNTGTSEAVGEAWLNGPQSVIATGPLAGWTLQQAARERSEALLGPSEEHEFPLLIKLLFPSDKLSVQVHPDDARARAMGQPRGKTECWYVVEAEPGAAVALGLREGTDADRVRRAIAEGTLEELLLQVPVAVGDMIFVDAGTVHAIGPGVVLLETQQTSDTTFRMWDYGRPRELHVDQGVAATKYTTRAGKVAPRQVRDGVTRLIEEQYFTVDRFDLQREAEARIAVRGPACLVGLAGEGAVVNATGSSIQLSKGAAVVMPAGTEVRVQSAGPLTFACCMAPPV